MADKTNISWADHTFNPWWGCTKIAPGCDNCYAAAMDKRTGGNYWEKRQAPRRTADANWKNPLRWNKRAVADGIRHCVFCGSMMDWCDKDAPEGALDDLFELIKATPMLDWQLLTKRATLIERNIPSDWGEGYPNVWLGVTCEDRAHGLLRIDALREIPAAVRFVSFEPLLEDVGEVNLSGIHWAIVGGESGSGYRAMQKEWAIELVARCSGTAVWFKQWGGNTRDKGGCMIGGRELKQYPENNRQVTSL